MLVAYVYNNSKQDAVSPAVVCATEVLGLHSISKLSRGNILDGVHESADTDDHVFLIACLDA